MRRAWASLACTHGPEFVPSANVELQFALIFIAENFLGVVSDFLKQLLDFRTLLFEKILLSALLRKCVLLLSLLLTAPGSDFSACHFCIFLNIFI